MEENMEEICDKCCDELHINNQYIGQVFQWLIDNNYGIYKIDLDETHRR